MTTQQVLRLSSPGSIASSQEAIPTPLPHELLIKIHAVALNGRDIHVVDGTYALPVKDGVVMGSDCCGIVAGVGGEVEGRGFEVGDVVINALNPMFLYGSLREEHGGETFGALRDGVLREWMTIPASGAVKIPGRYMDGRGYEHWASLVQAGSTVWNALYGNKRLMPGDTVLALGTGGISLIALILTKAAGATTIITSSSDEKLQTVKEKYGIDHAINYTTHSNWAAEVQRITHGKGADHIIESSGVGTIGQSLKSVARAGVISIIGFLTPHPSEMPDLTMGILYAGCVVRGVQGGSKQQLEELVRFVGERGLVMPVEKTFPFTKEAVVEALGYLASGKHVGKVCIKLD